MCSPPPIFTQCSILPLFFPPPPLPPLPSTLHPSPFTHTHSFEEEEEDSDLEEDEKAMLDLLRWHKHTRTNFLVDLFLISTDHTNHNHTLCITLPEHNTCPDMYNQNFHIGFFILHSLHLEKSMAPYSDLPCFSVLATFFIVSFLGSSSSPPAWESGNELLALLSYCKSHAEEEKAWELTERDEVNSQVG